MPPCYEKNRKRCVMESCACVWNSYVHVPSVSFGRSSYKDNLKLRTTQTRVVWTHWRLFMHLKRMLITGRYSPKIFLKMHAAPMHLYPETVPICFQTPILGACPTTLPTLVVNAPPSTKTAQQCDPFKPKHHYTYIHIMPSYYILKSHVLI